jgi:hypothetical protein
MLKKLYCGESGSRESSIVNREWFANFEPNMLPCAAQNRLPIADLKHIFCKLIIGIYI